MPSGPQGPCVADIPGCGSSIGGTQALGLEAWAGGCSNFRVGVTGARLRGAGSSSLLPSLGGWWPECPGARPVLREWGRLSVGSGRSAWSLQPLGEVVACESRREARDSNTRDILTVEGTGQLMAMATWVWGKTWA